MIFIGYISARTYYYYLLLQSLAKLRYLLVVYLWKQSAVSTWPRPPPRSSDCVELVVFQFVKLTFRSFYGLRRNHVDVYTSSREKDVGRWRYEADICVHDGRLYGLAAERLPCSDRRLSQTTQQLRRETVGQERSNAGSDVQVIYCVYECNVVLLAESLSLAPSVNTTHDRVTMRKYILYNHRRNLGYEVGRDQMQVSIFFRFFLCLGVAR